VFSIHFNAQNKKHDLLCVLKLCFRKTTTEEHKHKLGGTCVEVRENDWINNLTLRGLEDAPDKDGWIEYKKT